MRLMLMMMERGSMAMQSQLISVPLGISRSLIKGSSRNGDPLAIRIRQARNRSRGSSLKNLLMFLSEIKCEFDLKSASPDSSIQILIAS